MSMKYEYFSAFTSEAVSSTDKYLPLPKGAQTDLADIIKEDGSYIYLTLLDDANIETVKVTLVQGFLVMERGLSGTKAVNHPVGTCVSSISPTVIAVIKDLICNYDCCEDGDCPKTPVQITDVYTPSAKVGSAFRGIISFTGSDPVQVTVSGAPDWLTIARSSDRLDLTGTPVSAGQVTFSVALSNLNGTKTAVQTVSFTVQ